MTDENTAIAEINRAEQALERANDIHEMIELRNKAAAVALFTNAQGFKEAAQKAKIFQLKAERKAGRWLEQNITVGGSPESHVVTLGDIDVDNTESVRWQLEAKLPEDKFNNWVDESLAHGWEISAGGLRRIAQAHLGEPPAGGRSIFEQLSSYPTRFNWEPDKTDRFNTWLEAGKEFLR